MNKKISLRTSKKGESQMWPRIYKQKVRGRKNTQITNFVTGYVDMLDK